MTEDALRRAFVTFISAAKKQAAAGDVYLDSFGEALEAAALALGEASEPVAQEPGRSDSASGLFQAAAEWLAQYAGEIECSHYMPTCNEWDDAEAHRDFDGLRETAKALDAAQGQWDALVRERNRISALHAESQREIDRLRPTGMDAARAKAIEDAATAILAVRIDCAGSESGLLWNAACCSLAGVVRALATPSPLTEKGKNGE